MTEYNVDVKELITHTITVEADNEDAAYELAYKLLRDISTEELEKTHGYYSDSEGFTGEHSIEEA